MGRERDKSSPMNWWVQNRSHLDSNIDRDIERSCTSKDAYETEEIARAHSAMNKMSGVLFTYHCRYCQMWHLTRRPNSGA